MATATLILQDVIPALTLAKDSVTGLGVPRLEATIGGTLNILNVITVSQLGYSDTRKTLQPMLSTM